MRYSEITSLPSSPEEAKNAVLDLISVYSGKDKPSVPMKEILSLLHDKGYDATASWVMDILQNKGGVKRVTPQEVILKTEDLTDTVSDDEQQKSQDKVQKMASKAARKGMK